MLTRRTSWLALGALGLAVALLATLAYRHRALEAEYRELRRRALYPHAGVYVPAFSARTVDGDSVTVGQPAPGRLQVLLVFNTTCPYCRASIPAWKRLAADADGPVVGLSLDSPARSRAYAREHALPYPVISLLDPRLVQLYRARRVPMLLAVDSAGQVRFARMGPLEEGAPLDSVLRAIGAGTSRAWTPHPASEANLSATAPGRANSPAVHSLPATGREP